MLRGSTSMSWNSLDTRNVLVWLGTSSGVSFVTGALVWFGLPVTEEVKQALAILLTGIVPAVTAGRALFRLLWDNPDEKV